LATRLGDEVELVAGAPGVTAVIARIAPVARLIETMAAAGSLRRYSVPDARAAAA
jgi:hypothetical protein